MKGSFTTPSLYIEATGTQNHSLVAGNQFPNVHPWLCTQLYMYVIIAICLDYSPSCRRGVSHIVPLFLVLSVLVMLEKNEYLKVKFRKRNRRNYCQRNYPRKKMLTLQKVLRKNYLTLLWYSKLIFKLFNICSPEIFANIRIHKFTFIKMNCNCRRRKKAI